MKLKDSSNNASIPNIVMKQIALVDAMLSGMKDARFLIVLPDGSSYGQNLIEHQQEKTSKKQIERGSLSKIYKPLITDRVKVGEVIVINCNETTCIKSMRSSAQAYATKIWGGNGSCISCADHKARRVELMRSA